MDRASKIFVAGHAGLVGSAVRRALKRQGYENLALATRTELDLRRQREVEEWLAAERPDVVIMAAAKVGGIHANDAYPADFIAENLQIQTNLIDASYRAGVRKFVFLGSSCIYPKHAPQPMSEDALLTGPLEPTNQWYAVAKIAGIKMGQAYRRQYGFDVISVMPTNLYGPGDNFHPENSHVLPALIRRFHRARVEGAESVTVWGTGKPRREFLYADDLADAIVFLMERYSDEPIINVGVGEDISIAELAQLVARVVGYEGRLEFDPTRPDGTPRKLMDVSKLRALGWSAKTPLPEGIEATYRAFLAGDGAREV